MALTTSTEIAAWLQDRFAAVAVNKLVADLDIVNVVPPFEDPEPTSQANVYKVPITGAVAANSRAQGASVTDQNITDTSTTITVTEYESSEPFDPRVLAQTSMSHLEAKLLDKVAAVAEKVNTEAMLAISNQVGLSSVGTDNVAVTQANLQTVKNAFSAAKIPARDRYLIVSSETENDLRAIANFLPAFQYSGAVLGGKLPNIETFDVRSTPYCKEGAAGHVNLAFWAPGLKQIFAPQTSIISESRVKATMRLQGVTVSILWELVPGTNGGERITVSAIHGIKAVRSAAAHLVLGK
jgi:hypothetical protein